MASESTHLSSPLNLLTTKYFPLATYYKILHDQQRRLGKPAVNPFLTKSLIGTLNQLSCHKGKAFICPNCGEKFTKNKKAKDHLVQNHPEASVDGGWKK